MSVSFGIFGDLIYTIFCIVFFSASKSTLNADEEWLLPLAVGNKKVMRVDLCIPFADEKLKKKKSWKKTRHRGRKKIEHTKRKVCRLPMRNDSAFCFLRSNRKWWTTEKFRTENEFVRAVRVCLRVSQLPQFDCRDNRFPGKRFPWNVNNMYEVCSAR